MKAIGAALVFLFRWLPIVVAAALIAWDLWGKAPLYRHRDQAVAAVSARDGRLHVLQLTFAADRPVEGVTFTPDRSGFRVKLSSGAVSGPFIVTPPPLLSPSLGFQSETLTMPTTGTRFQRLIVPEWPVIVGLILLASSGPTLRSVRRRRRKRLGLCTSCGYDLRGTPGAHCPDCGSTAPTAA